MASRTYAILNDAVKGPLLETSEGALIVACNTPTTSADRLIRATIGRNTADGGVHGFECVFYGVEALLGYAAVGLTNSRVGLSTRVGGTGAANIGIVPGLSTIDQNGSSVFATSLFGQRVIFSVVCDFTNPASPSVAFYANGAFLYAQAIAAGTWFPSVSVGNPDTAYANKAFLTFGQRKLKYPIPNVRGWYTIEEPPPAVHFIPDDSGGLVLDDGVSLIDYAPRILNGGAFSFARRCSVAAWKGRTSGTTFGQLEIDNLDGAFDSLADEDYRDALVKIGVIALNTATVVYPIANRTLVATGVVDNITGPGEDSLRVTIKDPLIKLKRALQSDMFLPYLDEGVANSPVPITLGACRNVAPPLIEQTTRTFVAADAQLTNIAMARDKGAPLSPYSNPPQYVPTNDGRGVVVQTLPVGKFTLDISSEGSQVVIPGAADVLAGAGEFNAWPVPASPPTGWTGGGSGTRTRVNASAPFACSLFSSQSAEPSIGAYGVWLRTSSQVFQPGKSYRITFKITAAVGGSSVYGESGIAFGLMLRTALDDRAGSAITPHYRPVNVPNSTAFPNYTFTYQCNAAATAQYLYAIVVAPQGTVAGVGYGPGRITFYDLKIELLGAATADIPLVGITFEDYYREIFERRAGLTSAEWSSASAAALDTGDREFGVHIGSEVVTIDKAATMPLAQINADLYTDADGVIRFGELVDPRWYNRPGAVPVALTFAAEFDATQIKYGVSVEKDLAPGLTNVVGSRRNWSLYADSDFVSDFETVPASTRTKFKRTSQLQETSSQSLNSSYTHAVNAPPLHTLFDTSAPALIELNKILYPYSSEVTPPRFVKFTVYFDDVSEVLTLYFGSYIRVTYPRFGFNNGTALAVVDTVTFPHGGEILITAWGGTE